MKFYICNRCGNIITKLTDKVPPLSCCGEKMTELVPNTKEAAVEKHVPYILEEDGKRYVRVGSVEHPMTEDHYIEWIVVDYGDHYRVHHLKPNEEPKVKLCGKCEAKNIYAYCNLHGLWVL